MPLQSVKNQYIGINAHLHSDFQADGEWWEDFHLIHIGDLHQVLGEQLLPLGYGVSTIPALQVQKLDPDTGVPSRPTRPEADVNILDQRRSRLSPTAVVVEQAAPLTIELPIPLTFEMDETTFSQALLLYKVEKVEVKESRIGRPVAWIELLSSTNKPGGRHAAEYIRKRMAVIRGGLTLVEIDYLHESEPVIYGLPSYQSHAEQSHPYAIFVTDPRPSVGRGKTVVYPFDIDEPIPTQVKIPLADEDVFSFNFGVPYARTINKPSYALSVDYEKLPVHFSTYGTSDQDRIAARMLTIFAHKDELDRGPFPIEVPVKDARLNFEPLLSERRKMTLKPRTTQRLTMAQALVAFLQQQYVARDGRENPFFAGMFGIFGHGNVAGVGQAVQQRAESFRYYQTRNEQAMVHTAAAFAKMSNRLRTFACTSSIGPGATNMLTAAAGATINRLPVLLLPGDIFATRKVAPVLQQLEWSTSQDISVNDAFKPVSRYWDRINRPEQLITALPEAMRVLTSPADVGTVTLALPQDVQAEAFEWPSALFEKRVWTIPRNRPDAELLKLAARRIRESERPLIIAGGGVIYSEATGTLARFAERTGIPVVETMAGKGTLAYNHAQALGAVGATGTPGANISAREADLVIVVGSRLSDFTTASKTSFQNPAVMFININVCEFDALKHASIPLTGDARVTLEELSALIGDYHVSADYSARIDRFRSEWDTEVTRIYNLEHGPLISQGEVIGVVNTLSRPQDVMVCAAGSLPGDLHKLWRTRNPKGYHLEYGYSCMGYEIAGGLGIKMADPTRDVYVMVGDASYLMMAQEIVTSVQEGYKLIVVLLDNHGYASIGGLSESVGSGGFGTEYRFRDPNTGLLTGDALPLDFAANAASLGAKAIRATDRDSLANALLEAQKAGRTTVVVIETDREQRVGGYESWWDVPVAEVSEMETVQAARSNYEEARLKERYFL